MLLHAFLKYFAAHALSLPYLMPVPDGVGGLVLNWHIDSNAAIKPLQEMSSWTVNATGTVLDSYHRRTRCRKSQATKRALMLTTILISQDLIHKFTGLGYEIGSHGGWIHDYFSAHVETDNPKDSANSFWR